MQASQLGSHPAHGAAPAAGGGAALARTFSARSLGPLAGRAAAFDQPRLDSEAPRTLGRRVVSHLLRAQQGRASVCGRWAAAPTSSSSSSTTPPALASPARSAQLPVSHHRQPPVQTPAAAMERALSHSLASCSGLARPARSLQRLAAAPAAVRRPRAAAPPRAVAGLSRESLMQQPNLNAPSDEELASPVVAVSNPAAAAATPLPRALARRRCRHLSLARRPRTTNLAAPALVHRPGSPAAPARAAHLLRGASPRFLPPTAAC